MGFMTYDLILLALFVIGVVIFLSTRKKNLQRQGILYLYKTKIGIRFIDRFSKKFEKVLKPMQYVVLVSGYVLMISMIWLIIKTTHLYLTTQIAQVIKAPPIAPLIPYFPQIFGLQDVFPPLYFTYFILALGIVAISHEFSHGIFARLNGFKIHSTGFAFLGPILGAFVEPDEKQMEKAKKFPQMVVLAAGTFANVIIALIFGLLLALFFVGVFSPAGVKFNSYALSQINVGDVVSVNNGSIEGYLELQVNGTRYFVENSGWKQTMDNNMTTIIVYDDLPAFRAQMRGAITEINGKKIASLDSLRGTIQSYKPGDKVTVKTAILDPGKGTVSETKEYEMTLGEKDGKTSMGIGFIQMSGSGTFGWFYTSVFSKIKNPFLHYESSIGDFGWFIYYLLWWIVVIDFLVALFNMLPLGILDGGKFFYLTMWGIGRSEKFGKRAYKAITYFLLALFAALMLKWLIVFIK
jgi:membrane-associated protease RseP (regulator of RpoE activity)